MTAFCGYAIKDVDREPCIVNNKYMSNLYGTFLGGNVIELKYCPSCNRDRPKDGFKLVKTSAKGHQRWKCGVCQERKSATFYGSKK